MHEIDLGTIDANTGKLNELLGDADARLRQGKFHIVGSRDERGGVRGGALVQHVGNDQWSVYLLNEQQLEKVAQRQLQELGRESGGVGRAGSEMTTEAGITLAAHALGPVGMVLGPIAEVTSIAGSALGLGGDSAATKIARKLAADGVAPSDVSQVAQEVRSTTSDPNGFADAVQGRSSETDGRQQPDRASFRGDVSASNDKPGERTLDSSVARRPSVGVGNDASLEQQAPPDEHATAMDGQSPHADQFAATARSIDSSNEAPSVVVPDRSAYALPVARQRASTRAASDSLGLER